MPVVKVEVRGKKFHVVVDGTSVLETDSQGEVEDKLKELRKPTRPKSEVRDHIQVMLDECQDQLVGYLTTWEETFISDIAEFYEQFKSLTPGQHAKLGEIFAELQTRQRKDNQ